MKKLLTYLLTIIGLCAGCTNDPNWGVCSQHIEYQEQILTKQHSVKLTITFLGDIADRINSVQLVCSKDSSFVDAFRYDMDYLNKQATIELQELDSDITYYVRYLLTPEYLQTGSTSSFQTVNLDLPLATTISAYNITPVSATLSGAAKENGSYEILDKGIIYTLVLNDSTWYTRKSCKSFNSQGFYIEAENLRAGATYYYFAYATNRNGIAYGDTLSFTTPKTY